MHDCPCCGQPVYDPAPFVLCDDCATEGVECGPGAWHCTCDRACDGSACPGPGLADTHPWITASLIKNDGPEWRNGSTLDAHL